MLSPAALRRSPPRLSRQLRPARRPPLRRDDGRDRSPATCRHPRRSTRPSIQSWVQAIAGSFGARFAQPIVTPGSRSTIPPFETPVPNLFIASMFQVYPHDRGQNYSIELAERLVGRLEGAPAEPASPAPMTLARLWAFLAVGLPVLATLIANLSAVDLAYHLRAGEILLDTGQIPTTDTFTFTASGATWVNQQWGAQAILAAVYRIAGWTGLALFRAALVGAHLRLPVRGLPATRPRPPAGGLADARGVHRRGGRARRSGRSSSAWRSSPSTLAPRRRSARPSAPALGRAADRARLGERPRQLLPRAGRARPGLARGRPRPGAAPRTGLLWLALVSAAGRPASTRSGSAVWGYAVGLSTNSSSRAGSPSGSRRRCGRSRACCSSARSLSSSPLLARRGRADAVADARLARGLLRDRDYAIRGSPGGRSERRSRSPGVLAADARVARDVDRGRADATGTLESDQPRARRADRARLHRPRPGLAADRFPARARRPGGVVGDAPGGITAALRNAVQPGDRILNPQSWGSWFEFAFPDATVALDSRIEVFPAQVWDDTTGPRWRRRLAGHPRPLGAGLDRDDG